MGPTFVIIIWLIIAALFCLLWVASLALMLIGLRREIKWLKWLGAVPLTALSLFAVLVACTAVIGMVRNSTPKFVFADTFGTKPVPDIRDIRSKVWSFADSRVVHLQFCLPPETFHRLVPPDLERVTFAQYESMVPNLPEHSWPKWWQPVVDTTPEIYLHRAKFGEGRRFATETTLMTYDTQTGLAQYFFIGTD